MKKWLWPVFLISILTLSACGGGGFDPETAAKDSKAKLKEFFALYDNEEKVATLKNEDIKKAIDENMNIYFTKQYQEKINQALENRETEPIRNKALFFLVEDIKKGNTLFYNDYSIVDNLVKEENEVVILGLKTNEMSVKDSLLKIEMSMEDGEWKINKVR